LIRLGQGALLELRMRLCRQILATPLRRLEEFGAPRLMSSLTDDIPTITNALLAIPLICINVAVVIGGLIYLGWLSWWVLLLVLGFMAIGIATYQLAVIKAIRFMYAAREHTEKLFQHFRALTDGTKELKLHRRRREVFAEEVLKSSATAFRRESVKAATVYSGASSWGQALGFVVVGLLVFALPAWYAFDLQVMTGYVLVLLFVVTPLQVVMTTLPNLSRANIAVGRVEELGLSLTKYAAEERTSPHNDLPVTWESLELREVMHNYPSEEKDEGFMLGPIDLTLRPGELVFFIGGNGKREEQRWRSYCSVYTHRSRVRFDWTAPRSRRRTATITGSCSLRFFQTFICSIVCLGLNRRNWTSTL
jgi:putative ATP-binding cassette transporter